MKPDPRTRLQAAVDYDARMRRALATPAAIISGLIGNHGAVYKREPQTNTLRCAGVTATCTWSKDAGLLQAWRRNATVRLMALRHQAASA